MADTVVAGNATASTAFVLPGSVYHYIVGAFSNETKPAFSLILAAIAALPVALLFIKTTFFPYVDRREPPVLRSKIPLIGHAISLFKENTGYLGRLYAKHSLPICTLPILGSKLYAINSVPLITAAMRNKDVSFDPFALEFGAVAVGLSKAHRNLLAKPGVMEQFTNINGSSLKGEELLRVSINALGDLSNVLGQIGAGEPLFVPDVYLWLRTMISMSTIRAIFGENSPFTREVLPDLWGFDENVGLLSFNIFPTLTTPRGVASRRGVQKILKSFFDERLYDGSDVSNILKRRVQYQQSLGLSDTEIAIAEFALPWASTTNLIPSMFWMVALVFSAPEYIEQIRTEVLTVTDMTETETGRIASINIAKLEKSCSFLAGCHREMHRIYNANAGNRRVLRDTVIRDAGGREYLLKEGANVQWAANVPHRDPSIWGDDAAEFRPARWLDVSAEEERRRRGAMLAFGGGKNPCPGRFLSTVKILGFIGTLALGFEIEGLEFPDSENPGIGASVRRPVWHEGVDRGATIRRRPGWEDVEWRYHS